MKKRTNNCITDIMSEDLAKIFLFDKSPDIKIILGIFGRKDTNHIQSCPFCLSAIRNISASVFRSHYKINDCRKDDLFKESVKFGDSVKSKIKHKSFPKKGEYKVYHFLRNNGFYNPVYSPQR